MTIKKLIECFKKVDEFSFTSDLQATYFITSDGRQISFGYEEGYRSNDHRIIFGCFENIERNDWEKLIKETYLLMYIPENNEAWTLKDIVLTSQQKEFLKNYQIPLTRDIER